MIQKLKDYGEYVLWYSGVHLAVFFLRILWMRWRLRNLEKEVGEEKAKDGNSK